MWLDNKKVLTSILGIFVCIVCLCSTTFAWFTDVAPSTSNEIKMAQECLLSVTLTKDGTALTELENGVMLEEDVEYLVTLSLPANTASGYCVITAGESTYYTECLVRSDTPQTISFVLKVGSAQEVSFTSRWGIYTRDSDVTNGEQLLLP